MARVRGLLAASLQVGITGFGGGAAMIPLLSHHLVSRQRVVDDHTFDTHTVVSNITPGAQPVKITAMAGTHTGPVWAPAAAAATVAFPATAVTVLLLATFTLLGPGAIEVVEFLAVGISVFVALVLVHYVRKVLRSYTLLPSIGIMLLAFLATGTNQLVQAVGALVGQRWEPSLPQLSAVQVVLLALLATGVLAWFRRGRAAEVDAVGTSPASGRVLRSAGLLTVVGVVAWGASFLVGAGRVVSLVALSTMSSFGGGAAYIGVADGFFVGGGLVSRTEFYGQAVPVANALPGPVLVKLASAVGYLDGAERGGVGLGLLVATLCFLVAVASCSAFALVFLTAYSRLSSSSYVRALPGVVLPVICGFLLTTMVSMLNASVDIAGSAGVSGSATAWASVVGVGVLWLLQRRAGLHDLLLLALAGGVSLTALSLLG